MTNERRGTRPQHRNAGVMVLGGLLVLCGLAILLGLTPQATEERYRDYIAAGLVAGGIPFLVFGDARSAIAVIRSFVPFLNRRGGDEPPTIGPSGG